MAELKYTVLGDWSKSNKEQEQAVQAGKRAIKDLAAAAKTEFASLSKTAPDLNVGDIKGQLGELRASAAALGEARADLQKAASQGLKVKGITDDVDKQLRKAIELEKQLVKLANIKQPGAINSRSPYNIGAVNTAADKARDAAARSINDAAARRNTQTTREQQQAARREEQAKIREDKRLAAAAARIADDKTKQEARTARAKAKTEDPETARLIDEEKAANQRRKERNAFLAQQNRNTGVESKPPSDRPFTEAERRQVDRGQRHVDAAKAMQRDISDSRFADIPEGHVRYFRGQDNPNERTRLGEEAARSRWFTPDPEYANLYGKNLSYVDVPDSMGKASHARVQPYNRSLTPGHQVQEVLLPADVTAAAKALAEAPKAHPVTSATSPRDYLPEAMALREEIDAGRAAALAASRGEGPPPPRPPRPPAPGPPDEPEDFSEARTKAEKLRKDAEAASAFAALQMRPEFLEAVAKGNVDSRRGNAAQAAADARYSLKDPAAQAREASDGGAAEAEKRLRNARLAAETERQTVPFMREIVKNEAEAEVLGRRRKALLEAEIAAQVASRPSLIKQEAAAAVDTRRNNSAQGAEEARYSAADPLAQSKEINDQATKAAQDRKDTIARNLETERLMAADSEKLAQQTAETEKFKREQKLATRAAVAATYDQAEAEKRGSVMVREQANAERQQLELLRAQNAVYTSELSADKDSLQVKNQILIEQRKLRNAQAQQIKDAVALNRASGGAEGIPSGTRFQRLQQGISSRGGGSPRLPEEFQTLKQFMESKALTTAGFAFSGAILYGGISAIKEMIQGASELQKELSLVEAQFINTGKSATEFGEFKDTIIEISKETGVAAVELSKVGRSLLGVFRVRDESKPLEKQDQGPNVKAAQDALEVSAKFSAVTGVDSKTITDEFVAIFKSFEDVEKGLTFQHLADSLVAVEEESGVAADQLLNIAGTLAPVVSQMGVSTDELIRYSAAATQGSAKDASAISDGLNRFLTELPGQTSKILDLYQQSPELGTKAAGNLQKKIASGDMSQVIDQLIKDYQKFSPELKGKFNEKVIGGRNTQSVVGLFENPTLALRNIDGQGKLDERFEKVRDTLEEAMARAKAAVQELATAIFDAGLGDVLKNLAVIAGGVVEALTKFLNVILLGNEKLLAGKGTEAVGAVGAAAILTSLFRKGRQADISSILGGSRGVRGATGPLPITLDPVNGGIAGGSAPAGRFAKTRGFVKDNAGLIGASLALFGGQQILEARSNEQAQQKAVEKTIAGYTDKQVQAGTELGSSNRRKLMDTFSGGKTTSQLYRDEQQKRQAPGRRAVLSSLTDAEYKKAIGGVSGADRQGKQLKDRFSSQADLMDALAKNPENDDVEKAYLRLIDSYEAIGASDAYTKATAGADKNNVAISAGKDAADSLDDSAKKVDLAIESLKTGDSTLGEVRTAIGERTKKLQLMVDGAIAAGKPDPELEKQLAESKAQEASVVDLSFKSYADNIKKILDLRGETGPGGIAAQQEVDRFILSGFGNGISDEYRTSVAQDLADLQKKAIDYQVSQAQSVADAIKAAQTGTDNYDPVARFEVLKSQVGSELNSDAVSTLGGKDKIDDITSKIGDYLKIGKDASVKFLQERIKNWQTQNEILKSDMFQADIDKANAWISILLGAEDPAALSNDAKVNDAKIGYNNALAKIQGDTGLANSQTTNSIQQAENNQAAAAKILAEAKAFDEIANNVESSQAVVDAEAKYNESVQGTVKAHDALDTSLLTIAQAKAAGDPAALARIQKQSADLALQQAGDDPVAQNNAIAQGITADQAIRDAANDMQKAQLELVAAQNQGDPVAVAQAQLDLANLNVLIAKDGTPEKLRALANQITAKNSLAEAIGEILGAFYDVAIATRDAAGDAVGSAELQLEKINKLLAGARGRGDKQGELQLIAQKVSAEANLRDSKLADREGDIDFALQMEKITTGQAIQQLELLLKVPNLTKQQIQSLQLKIKELRDGSGLSQFNVPEDINLPTLYEVRRLEQLQGGTYQSARAGFEGGTTGPVDNSSTVVNIYASNVIEAQTALKVVKDTLTASPRSGVDYKFY